MSTINFDLPAAAHEEMIRNGFHPDFPAAERSQVAKLATQPIQLGGDLRDLRHLLWSSIDNDTTRDLDQLEFAERAASEVRLLIAIADVDRDVTVDSPIDRHAASETTSVYTAVRTFPMLPEELSTNLTSLLESQDRAAVVIELMLDSAGSIASSSIYRALVRNKAQLTYNQVGPWLQKTAAAPGKVESSPELQQQLQLQDEVAGKLRANRLRLGALNFDRVEAQPIVKDGKVQGLTARVKNRANDLIEDFMVAANETMAATLRNAGVSTIRRVVRSPDRWPRIVEIAGRLGDALPERPDSAALGRFLERRRAADPVHYEDLSLSVIKLLGPGEYVLARNGDPEEGHFGLAAHDYTHSTAPNRRFADLVIQRLIKAVIGKTKPPYSDEQLESIAQNCTMKENAARKVERVMGKRVAAVALQNRIGQTFSAVVTGVAAKGVFVRVIDPPAEGRLIGGEAGVDVGDKIQVKLLSTDVERGFIDFGR